MIVIILAQVLFWCIRARNNDLPARYDFLWISIALLWFYRKEVSGGVVNLPTTTWLLGFAFFLCIICYYLKIAYQRDRKSLLDPKTEASEKQKPSEPSDLRPLVFPCRTSHTRMFPKKHSFSYSYLLVGIPVGWQTPVGTFLSTSLDFPTTDNGKTKEYGRTRATWFHINDADYLNRGHHPLGLEGKLNDFLRTQVKTRFKPGPMKLNSGVE